jgi:single-strand DNA-binding protein
MIFVPHSWHCFSFIVFLLGWRKSKLFSDFNYLQTTTIEIKQLITDFIFLLITHLHHQNLLIKKNYIMSTLRNKVSLIGHVGNQPEIISLNTGKKIGKINLATNEVYYNDKGEKITETQWHNLVAWGKTSEIIEKYVEKGKEIAVEGKLTYRSYDDKNGEKKHITEIIISELLLLSK